MSKRITQNEVNRIIPPMEKEKAIEQSEKFEAEYEKSKKQIDKILKELAELAKEYENQV